MTIVTEKYVKKPLYVDAVRITSGNFEEIASWAQGDIREDDASGKKYIKIRVHNPMNPRQTKAFVGDWILYTEWGYKIYTNKAFIGSFEEKVETEDSATPYPYKDGDTTVIGPECFARPDGVVLNWKGVNYIPQTNLSVEEAVERARENGTSPGQSEAAENAS